MKIIRGFPDSSVVKNPPASTWVARDGGLIPGQEDPLEEGMATHSSVLAWRVPPTEEAGVDWVYKELDETDWLTDKKQHEDNYRISLVLTDYFKNHHKTLLTLLVYHCKSLN